MKQTTTQKQMSPVNIEQNRAVGQDSFAEGSRMGREANKAHGFPGEAEQIEGANSADARGDAQDNRDHSVPETSREDAIRQAAYEAYQRRMASGGGAGSETDDWLEAEAHVKEERGE